MPLTVRRTWWTIHDKSRAMVLLPKEKHNSAYATEPTKVKQFEDVGFFKSAELLTMDFETLIKYSHWTIHEEVCSYPFEEGHLLGIYPMECCICTFKYEDQ